MLFCYNENIIIVGEKYLFNNQDSQGYRRQDVVWGWCELNCEPNIQKKVKIGLN